MTPHKTVLKVSTDTADHASRFGAEFDRVTGTWFVLGPVHGELQNYVCRCNQPRPAGNHVRVQRVSVDELRPKWAEIVEEAAKSLGGDLQAVRWLNCRKQSFDDKSPIEMMGTVQGCDAVLELLRHVWS